MDLGAQRTFGLVAFAFASNYKCPLSCDKTSTSCVLLLAETFMLGSWGIACRINGIPFGHSFMGFHLCSSEKGIGIRNIDLVNSATLQDPDLGLNHGPEHHIESFVTAPVQMRFK